MPLVTAQQLIDAGVHFGHQASRWNPKMKPYIYGKRHRIHLIDLQATIRGLYQGTHFVRRLASTGAQILFLGTKRQIRAVIETESGRCGMPAVTERWIGGTMTNFNTVRERLKRLEELEAMESDGSMEKYKKKDQASLRREMRKIRRNLEGVRDLHGLPGAIIVVDPRREEICVREAARMNVPIVCILDTDCDPGDADIVIPANDDAMSSVQLLLTKLADAILEGRAGMDEAAAIDAQRAAADDVRARHVQGRQQAGGGGGGPRSGGGGGGRPGGGRPGGGGRGQRTPPPGGRLGRQSTGRFADRRSGQADAVSIGGSGGENEAAASATPPAAPPTPAAPPAAEAPPPAAEKPPAAEQPAAAEKPPAAETPPAPENDKS